MRDRPYIHIFSCLLLLISYFLDDYYLDFISSFPLLPFPSDLVYRVSTQPKCFGNTVEQGRAQEGAKVARATARLPSSTEVAPPKEIYIFLNSITAAELHVGLDQIIAE